MKAALAGIGAILLVAAIGIGAWQGGWWIKEKNVNRQVQIDNRQKGTQVAWRDEARNAVTDYSLVDPGNTAARGALRQKACSLIDRLVGPYQDDDLIAFELKEC